MNAKFSFFSPPDMDPQLVTPMADSQLQLKLRNELITAEFKSFSYKFKPRTNGEDKIDYLPTVQGFVGNLGSAFIGCF